MATPWCLAADVRLKQLASPPDVEWCDSAFIPNKKHDDIDILDMKGLPLKTQDSVVTIYVQHPISIPECGDVKAFDAHDGVGASSNNWKKLHIDDRCRSKR